MTPTDEPARPRRGVVLVHGVGGYRQSDALLDFAGPLLAWLRDWHVSAGETPPRLEEVVLGFSPDDAGGNPAPSHAGVVFGDGRRWMLAEAWWGASTRRVPFGQSAGYTVLHLWRMIRQLARACGERAVGLANPGRFRSSPSFGARVVDLVNALVLLVLYPVLGVVGLALALFLLLVARVPIPPLQDFVLVRLLRPFLEVNAGEFFAYLYDDLQAANAHRRLAEAVLWLVDERRGEQRCSDVTIVAHSEGCVMSFGMLSDPAFASAAAHVHKLVTLGAGLNKAWLVAPDLSRLHGPLPDHIYWLDIWASYDPVPAGWLEPPFIGRKRVRIFQPDQTVVQTQRLDDSDNNYWPDTQQVTNAMSVLADHGGYFTNGEQVLVRLAAELDEPAHERSRYWQGDDVRRGVVRARRERVTWLAAARALLVVAWVVSLVAMVWRAVLAWQLTEAGTLALWTSVPFVLAYVAVIRPLWGAWDARAIRAATAALAKARVS